MSIPVVLHLSDEDALKLRKGTQAIITKFNGGIVKYMFTCNNLGGFLRLGNASPSLIVISFKLGYV
jgi:hypothetical protein